MRDVIRVVVVEDKKPELDCLEVQINFSEGMEVVGAFESFEACLRSFPKCAADVVLMDLGLPGGKDGVAGCEIIKRRWPRVKVVALTIADGQRIIDALVAGVDGYLSKHKTSRHELAHEIREVYAGRFPMSPEAREEMASYLRNLAVIMPDRFPKLSPAERRILGEIIRGRVQKQIADDFGMSLHTVKWHMKRIREKTGAKSSVEAASHFRIGC